MSPSEAHAGPDATLDHDVDLKSPLLRVSYQPGMLLGLNATRDEQSYHLRHRNRHSYWLHGSGTVAGLRVGINPGDQSNSNSVQLVISPGIGVDGLGREVSVEEPYGIDLGAWLTRRIEEDQGTAWKALLRDGLDLASDTLWLKITMRYQDRPSGLQPVMAFGVNAGTDAVQPSKQKDSVLYELIAERPPTGGESLPFAAHKPLPPWDQQLTSQLEQMESERIAAADDPVKVQLQLAARLLHAFDNDATGLDTRAPTDTTASDQARDLARTLLARVSVALTPAHDGFLTPLRVAVDNLARPFLFNASLLAQLLSERGTP